MGRPLGAGSRRDHHNFSQQNLVESQSAKCETPIAAALGVRHGEACTRKRLSGRLGLRLKMSISVDRVRWSETMNDIHVDMMRDSS